MAFHDKRFPDLIAVGAQGGPEASTSIAESAGGNEQRNGNWSSPRLRFNVGTGLKDGAGIAELIAFFRLRLGRLHGFRFKDWSDYTMERQTIGATDGSDATWQIFKTYSDGTYSANRTITKPVSGTVRCWVDNVERALGAGATQFQVNLLTGVITLGSTLAALSAKTIEAACEFDVPARFDTDNLPINLDAFEIGQAPDVPVIEIRE
ncbi:MAG: DUF2460 domain-containing protein [Burkholderiales bacterium]|nr:DUF2460 domain-containing protein [Burkholderiales bacterium]MDQ5979342.1 hypothetical protein [Verrucomicrobiota bacterium]